ncbi:MAG: transglutaminase-like domain-containing protein [Candidatus Methanoperedens sp.]
MIQSPQNVQGYETQDESIIMCGRTDSCEEDEYPYKERRDVIKIYNEHKNHPVINIPDEAKKIVDFIKLHSKSEKEIAKKICEWVSTNIIFDNAHADASRANKKGLNKIYMNATEAFNTRTGICGEKSFLVIGMLNYIGIPSTIYRPGHSHIAVITKIDNQHFMCDATFNQFREVQPNTKKSSKESHYEIGVSDIKNNYEYNWSVRRQKGVEFGLKNYDRELTVEELLDVERAHLCEPLKYRTSVGLTEKQKMKSECDKRHQRIWENNLIGE